MISSVKFSVSVVIGALALAACSSKAVVPDDGGNGTDGGNVSDAKTGTDAKSDAKQGVDGSAMCPTPGDVSGYKPEMLTPPNGKHQNKCTSQQLADYKACINGDMAKCGQFNQGMPGEPCVQCIETDKTAAKHGPVIIDGQNAFLNVEGCVNLALNEMGPTSCGQLLHDSYGCQDLACADICQGDDTGFSKCVDTALKTVCKTYGDKFDMTCSAKIDSDAAPADVANCFQKSANEPVIDWEMRMVTYFCGP